MRFTLHRKTELALRALRTLDHRRDTVPGSDLAEQIGTTANYLPQVMAPLVRTGWVESGRGPNGGYTLNRPDEDVSMRALIEASEGPLPTTQCVLRGGPCESEEICTLHDSWQQAQATLLAELDEISVWDQE